MHLKVPEVRRCCCCVPLRPGIILFGYLNIILFVVAIACLVVSTELRKLSITSDVRLESMTSTVLFSIFGMHVILNILLVVAGIQKDEAMLRLYTYYAVATTLSALIPTSILLARSQYYYVDVTAACFAIAVQFYVIVLVRSEVLKMEKRRMNLVQRTADEVVDVSDDETLV